MNTVSNTTISPWITDAPLTGYGNITLAPYTYPQVENWDVRIQKVSNGFVIDKSGTKYVFENVDNLLIFLKENFSK